jgi:hypothetical protein
MFCYYKTFTQLGSNYERVLSSKVPESEPLRLHCFNYLPKHLPAKARLLG